MFSHVCSELQDAHLQAKDHQENSLRGGQKVLDETVSSGPGLQNKDFAQKRVGMTEGLELPTFGEWMPWDNKTHIDLSYYIPQTIWAHVMLPMGRVRVRVTHTYPY